MVFNSRTALPLLLGLAAPALVGCELRRNDEPAVSGSGGAGGRGGSGGETGNDGEAGDDGGVGAGGEAGSGGEGGGQGAVCGDGAVAVPAEACDDGNRAAGDGCDPDCAIEPGFACAGAPSVCTAGCGDGALGGQETCDDGGNEDGDCCSHACQVEPGCEIEPNDDAASARDAFTIAPDGRLRAFLDPAGDVDVFSVTVPAGAIGRLRAATLDGPLGTTCGSLGIDTHVTILDGSLEIIASNDDIADDNYCSSLELHELAPGDYLVSVEISPAAEPATFDYTLSLTLKTTVCGDGVLERPELCDDGNATDGDGCSAACELERAAREAEPNDTAADAGERAPLAPNALVTGAIEPLGDVDVFAFTVPRIAEIQLATFDPGSLSACSPGVDTFLQLLDADGETVLASDDDSGPEACSLLDSTVAPWATRLSPGTYYVTVEEFSNDDTIAGYNLLVAFTALCGDGVVDGEEACDGGDRCSDECTWIAVCGDGSIDGPEACDDGNTVSGDGCSAACELEGTLQEIEPNDAQEQATAVEVTPEGALLSASISPAGDVDVFAIHVPGVADLEIETFDASGPRSCRGVDTVALLLAPDGALMAEDDDGGEGRCSRLQATITEPGVYHVRIEGYDAGSTAAYTLRVRTTALCGDGVVEGNEECDGGAGCAASCQRIPVCGDGFLDDPEICDDGNTEGGDGCDAACRLEGVTAEIEPNGTPAEADANGALAPGALVSGVIAPDSDVDVFALRLTTLSDLRLETFDSSGPSRCADGVDTALTLLAPDGATVLASDDDGGVGACALIDPASPGGAAARRLEPGTYYVLVHGFPEVPGARYTLRASLDAACGNGVREGSEPCDGGALCTPRCERIPVCGDGFVDAPEGCDDGGTAGGDGCSADCQLEAVTAEIEPNDTPEQAAAGELVIAGDALIAARIDAGGDRDVFRVRLPAASVVRLEVLDGTAAGCAGGIATTLRVLDAGTGALVATDEGLSDAEYAGGIGGCSALVLGLPAGEHLVEVAARDAGAAIPIYLLQATILAPAGAEEEPNNTLASANGPLGSDVFIAGTRTTDDFDLYAVDLPEGRSIRAEIVEGGAETCESLEMDSRLSLLDARGLSLADDDDGGRGRCSLLDGTGAAPRHPGAHALPAGTYYLRVRGGPGAAGSAAVFDYRLAVTIR